MLKGDITFYFFTFNIVKVKKKNRIESKLSKSLTLFMT